MQSWISEAHTKLWQGDSQGARERFGAYTEESIIIVALVGLGGIRESMEHQFYKNYLHFIFTFNLVVFFLKNRTFEWYMVEVTTSLAS
jgi:hypothetical protein